MPFITQEARERLLHYQPTTPGEACYIQYKEMMYMWSKAPCWSTVDYMLQSMLPDLTAEDRATILALMVFFQLHVMPYELKKREENGDV